ncbi:MFS transporter [Fodinicola acaciae]|uniref:MFS transporter n=1 Tax=Fodinicola acaciae TaxID=2681555 RepID=UPI0013D6BF5C|nr:MFS transporter [Fodinicola acaciae]
MAIDSRHRATALLVAACFFMEILDGTIVSTAAPQMGGALRVAPTAIGLVITAYLVTLAVLIPLSGWLTARFGARRVFLTAIALFTLASLACALTRDLGQLVAMRIAQGAAGAMMVPVGRLVVLSNTAKPDIPRVMSYVVWPGLLAPVVAPLLGGLITTYADWRWMFLVNVPLGVVAYAVAWRLIDAGAGSRPPRLDWLGVALVGGSLGSLTYAAHLVSESGPTPTVVVFLVVTVVAGGVAGWHLLRTPAPLVNLRTLRVATFRTSVTGGSLFWITCGALPFLLPLLFQDVFGWSPVKSGAVVLFVFVGNLAIKPATTFLLNRLGFRRLLTGSAIALAATVVACAWFTADTPLVVIAAVALLSGVARSVGLTGYSTIAFSDTPPDDLRDANALSATAQQTAAGLGVAVAAVALQLGHLVAGPAAYAVAFVVLAAIALLAGVTAVRLHPTAGDAVRRPAAVGGQVAETQP